MMENTHCIFCGSPHGMFPIHGIMLCPVCKSGLPADEPEDQDLFDDEPDFQLDTNRLSFILSDLLVQR